MHPQESELVLNADGSVYHLCLKREHIANHVLLVGDPGRVSMISARFDSIEHKISNREFVTHTGMYKGTRITALATGIGTDNIDIVVNELDAAVNFDLERRTPLKDITSLNLIRIGTCGAIQADLPVNSTVVSEWAIGLDGVRHFYDIVEHRDEERIRTMLEAFLGEDLYMNPLYVARASQELLARFQHLGKLGMTLTANGFFGPQGRSIRLPLAFPNFNEEISKFETHGARIENYEMESSALFALGGALGHECLSLCVVVANRKAKEFSKDYAPAMHALITGVLDTLAEG
ncbi:MAG: nucleoside phosphorylase [Flavobacteriales bacterium]|nr:nucleoside phosphorylase [Flavobacteriales bacterium]